MSDLEQMNVELQGLKKISAKKQADKAAGLGIGLGAMLAIAGIVLFAPNPQATDGNEALFVLACASSFLLPLVLGVGFYKLTIKRTVTVKWEESPMAIRAKAPVALGTASS